MLKIFKSRSILGLDIGSHSIKAIQLSKKGEQQQLAALALKPIPLEVRENSDSEAKSELLADLIKRMLKENDIRTKNVVTSVSGDSVIVRYVKLPYMTYDELKNVIAYEAEQYIPLAIDQVILDFTILGELEEDHQRKIEVLLVAAKDEFIHQHLDLIRKVGLNPMVIDVDTFALQNAYEYNYGRGDSQTLGLIHIGAKLTTINIIESGVTHLTRDVAVAGDNFTREIERGLSVDFARSEELKYQDGKVMMESEDIMQMEIPKKDTNEARIGEAITPILNKLVAEIQRSFDYYENTIKKSPIAKVVLSGGTSRLPNLDKYLAEKLHLEVALQDPFRNIVIPARQFDPGFIQKNSQLFIISLGLALRQGE